jgi:hypothetical protein
VLLASYVDKADNRYSFTRPPPTFSLEEDTIYLSFLIVIFNYLRPLHLIREVGISRWLNPIKWLEGR